MDQPTQQSQNDAPVAREGANVAVRQAAAMREKSEPTFGAASISLWTFFFCAIVLMLGGNHMGKLAGGFDSSKFLVPGYVPKPPPGKDSVVEQKPWIDTYMALGKKRFTTCAACHGPDGAGNPASNYPPLAGSEWTTGPTEKFGLIILAGLQGPVTVKGKTYVNVMPSQAAGLTANDLGAVMTYVRRSFGNDASIVTPEMAQVALDLYAKRQAEGKAAFTADELLRDHAKMLPGAEVDPQTGKPATAAATDPATGTAPAAAH